MGESTPRGYIKIWAIVRDTVAVTKVFPGDVIAEEYSVIDQAEIHKIAKKYMTKRQQGYFMAEIRELLGVQE